MMSPWCSDLDEALMQQKLSRLSTPTTLPDKAVDLMDEASESSPPRISGTEAA